MSRRTDDVTSLIAAAREGRTHAVARLITLVEAASPQLREVMAALAPYTGNAHVIGLTGAPGVGKSTTTSALVAEFRRRGLTVAVLAIDPSSPFSGGALLGDRIRMTEHASDRGVYIRSMASRGHLGGLSWSTPQALRVVDAAGFDVVLVETVGVGQSEVEIARAADTTVVLLAPGMGDGIQAAKAGILEIGDLYVVNKSDRDGAHKVRRDIFGMLKLADRDPAAWDPPVLATSSLNDQGLAEVADALIEHHEWLVSTGTLRIRRERRARDEIEAIAVQELRSRWTAVGEAGAMTGLSSRVAAGELDPYAAADALLAAP